MGYALSFDQFSELADHNVPYFSPPSFVSLGRLPATGEMAGNYFYKPSSFT
jgi:hypothetical protein